jgi:hypothetical protein
VAVVAGMYEHVRGAGREAGRDHRAELDALEDSLKLAARLYRHVRSIARDVADEPRRDAELAATMRSIGGAVDLALGVKTRRPRSKRRRIGSRS